MFCKKTVAFVQWWSSCTLCFVYRAVNAKMYFRFPSRIIPAISKTPANCNFVRIGNNRRHHCLVLGYSFFKRKRKTAIRGSRSGPPAFQPVTARRSRWNISHRSSGSSPRASRAASDPGDLNSSCVFSGRPRPSLPALKLLGDGVRARLWPGNREEKKRGGGRNEIRR